MKLDSKTAMGVLFDDDAAEPLVVYVYPDGVTTPAEQCPAIREVIAASVAFTPGPPVPAPKPQYCEHMDIARRGIEGDDEIKPRVPSLEETLRADDAAQLWPTPVRSSSDTDRFGKDAIGGGDGRAYDPHRWRDEHILRQREYDRVADATPDLYGLTGREQLDVWRTLILGRLQERNIHAGAGTDAITREEARAAKRAERGSKRRKRAVMEPPPPRKAFYAPERVPTNATELALSFREQGRYVTPTQLGIVKREFTERVRNAFAAKGWPLRVATKRAQHAQETKGAIDMATGDYIDGWGEIAKYLKVSVRTAQSYIARGLPIRDGLGGGVCVKRAELDEWQEQARAKRAAS